MIAVSSEVGQKAQRLVEEGCVRLESMSLATVKGDSGEWHQVSARPAVVFCDCRAWTPRRSCSHATAAQIAWSERIAGSDRAGDAATPDAATAPGAVLPLALGADNSYGDAA